MTGQARSSSSRRKLTRVARQFITTRRLTHLPCQFDVIAIGVTATGAQCVEHFIDAFEAVE